MMNDKLQIKDVCSRFSSGKSISASKIHESGEYPVFGGNGLRGYTDTFNFEGDCAVIGRQGAYCGNVKLFSGKGYMTEHAIVAVANKNNNSRFLAYKFALMDLGRYAGQSAQPGLSVETLLDVEIEVPPKNDQDNIAEALSTIDTKIDNNNAICADLEAMAKLLYDYWFVQFDFPDENGKPYKSSGGKMVWYEDLKREIPEGWEVGRISDICSFENGDRSDNYPKESEFVENGIPFLSGSCMNGASIDMSAVRYIKKEKSDMLRSGKAYKNDLLFTLRGSIGKCVYSPFDFAVINAALVILRERTVPKSYLFSLLRADYYQKLFQNNNNGSIQANLSVDILSEMKCLIPEDNVLNMYDKNITPLTDLTAKLLSENQQLTSLRDFLLPMLMNGQVKVGGKGDLPPVAYPTEEARDEYMIAAEPQKVYDAEGKGV